jgi:hypothetical protein
MFSALFPQNSKGSADLLSKGPPALPPANPDEPQTLRSRSAPPCPRLPASDRAYPKWVCFGFVPRVDPLFSTCSRLCSAKNSKGSADLLSRVRGSSSGEPRRAADLEKQVCAPLLVHNRARGCLPGSFFQLGSSLSEMGLFWLCSSSRSFIFNMFSALFPQKQQR